jgi:hypothetical protein
MRLFGGLGPCPGASVGSEPSPRRWLRTRPVSRLFGRPGSWFGVLGRLGPIGAGWAPAGPGSRPVRGRGAQAGLACLRLLGFVRCLWPGARAGRRVRCGPRLVSTHPRRCMCRPPGGCCRRGWVRRPGCPRRRRTVITCRRAGRLRPVPLRRGTGLGGQPFAQTPAQFLGIPLPCLRLLAHALHGQ